MGCIEIHLKKEQPPSEILFFLFKQIDGNYQPQYTCRYSVQPVSRIDTSTDGDRVVTRYSN